MQLATGGDDNAAALTDAYDWYIMPVVNPDGYVYTWTNVGKIVFSASSHI
jgi:murein tripeptide amidase MpaA